MSNVLVDSNVLLDIFTEDERCFTWSSETLSLYAENNILVINPIIYAEVSIGFDRIEDLEEAMPPQYFLREALPDDCSSNKNNLRIQKDVPRQVFLPSLYWHHLTFPEQNTRPLPLILQSGKNNQPGYLLTSSE